jgi:hypothetical protein
MQAQPLLPPFLPPEGAVLHVPSGLSPSASAESSNAELAVGVYLSTLYGCSKACHWATCQSLVTVGWYVPVSWCEDMLPMSAVPLQMGYLRSWSAYHTYLDKHPQSDPLPAFGENLLKSLDLQVWTRLEVLPAQQSHPVCFCASQWAGDVCRVHVERGQLCFTNPLHVTT